ncbi:MAG: Gfo/Idh/MocA family oxidoreductase [Planctomycetes bacterium]|nr:Gfo/Idh/MocA family oxidoreductase [Planctomycetota bacterium]
MRADRSLRIGMVGGGPGAFIGAVHRLAAEMDREFELVAGAFSSSPEKSAEAGAELGLNPERVYPSWQDMLVAEAALPEESRIHAVSIVTPNHVHHGPAVAALNAGFHVICDKPMTVSTALAEEMREAADSSGKVFALTHNYAGYPMIREARDWVHGGGLGDVRKVYAEYFQGWLAEDLESTGQKQAGWRTDPNQSGPGGSLGDIGTHAFHLLEHVTGLQVERLFGKVSTFVEGRRVDDDAMVLVEMNNGANGSVCASQVCVGRENGLKLRVFGTKGGLEWDQEHPNDLTVWRESGIRETRRTGNAYLSESAQAMARIPAGHPEGYLEGFANIYRAFAAAIRGEKGMDQAHPTAAEGCRGVRFIEASLESSASQAWVHF